MATTDTPTCTVCLIVKNEAPYLVEWVAYYRVLGFDEIIVYDNNSTDGTGPLLQALAREGLITYRQWLQGRTQSPQITAYVEMLARGIDSDWVLFVDTDEFLVLHHHETVGEFLATLHGREDVAAIGVNWRIFGDSGLAAPDGRPSIVRFTQGAEDDFISNNHIKCFSRVSRIEHCDNMHACQVRGAFVHASGAPLTMGEWGLSLAVELDVAQVNHFCIRTPVEYAEKKRRGRGGFAEIAPEKHNYDAEIYDFHNRNEVRDVSAQRHLGRVLAEMERLETIVAKAGVALSA